MEGYESYEDSGVDWIGNVPSDWTTRKLKRVFSIEKKISGELGYDVLSVTQKGLKVKDLNDHTGQHSMDYSKYQIVEQGDFVMNHMDLLTGFVDLSVHQGVTSPDYRVFRSRTEEVYDPYCLYIFQMCYHRRIFYGLGRGVSNLGRWRLPSVEFLEFKLPTPPLHEQEQIVEYLDRKTTLIDSLIEKTVRKIELLKEKRTSLINEVVTKGLNPDVEMKDSGVEWIGEIPSHFNLVRLRYLCDVSTGGKDTKDAVDGGDFEFFVRSPKILRIDSYSFDGEAVLTVGDGAGTGKVFHHVIGKFDFHQRVYKFSGFKGVRGRFFYFFMIHHFIFVTEDQNSKSTVDSLRRPLIDNFWFVVPPLHEQEQIVEYLDEQTAIIDSTITTEEKRIELLKEYRQSMISEVVTGKVKVTRDE